MSLAIYAYMRAQKDLIIYLMHIEWPVYSRGGYREGRLENLRRLRTFEDHITDMYDSTVLILRMCSVEWYPWVRSVSTTRSVGSPLRGAALSKLCGLELIHAAGLLSSASVPGRGECAPQGRELAG